MDQIAFSFITGLTTGGLSCLAVQGGLVASAVSAQGSTGQPTSRLRIVTAFVVSKLFAHLLLGFLLGSAGSLLMLSPKTMGVVQAVTGIYLILTAFRIVNIHPVFRYFVISPPRWAYRLVRAESKEASWLAPVFLGLYSVLLPCGATQAMMLVSVASGSGIIGAAIMGAFVLGTSPLFVVVGVSISQLLTRPSFAYIAALALAVFGISTLNGGLVASGSPYTLQNFYKAAVGTGEIVGGEVAGVRDGFQHARITVRTEGYSSLTSKLKAGLPVRLWLETNNTEGCSRAFTIPDYGISKILPKSGVEVIEFTPDKPGRLAYTCSMGMHMGAFEVIP